MTSGARRTDGGTAIPPICTRPRRQRPPKRCGRALGDPAHVLARAKALRDEGKIQLALHVVDLLALGNDGDPLTREAQALKAELCTARAEEVTSVVSRNLYLSAADELTGRPIGAAEQARGESSHAWE